MIYLALGKGVMKIGKTEQKLKSREGKLKRQSDGIHSLDGLVIHSFVHTECDVYAEWIALRLSGFSSGEWRFGHFTEKDVAQAQLAMMQVSIIFSARWRKSVDSLLARRDRVARRLLSC